MEGGLQKPKIKAYIPLYEPLELVECKKCRKIITEPRVSIRIASAPKPDVALCGVRLSVRQQVSRYLSHA